MVTFIFNECLSLGMKLFIVRSSLEIGTCWELLGVIQVVELVMEVDLISV